MFCHGLKGEFGSMFIRVVTMSRMRFFGVVFRLFFLTTEAKDRSEVRGGGAGGGFLEGLFQASQASQASQANVCGLFCNFEASQGAQWDALKSEFGPMITVLGTLGRFEISGSFLRVNF